METKEETKDFSLQSLLEEMNEEQRDKFADEVAKVVRNNMYPLRPSKLELMLTERCNLACEYCFLGNHGEQRDMTPETAEKAIDFFLENAPTNDATLSIVHFGGEPLLALPLMKHVMEYARKNVREGQTVTFQCTSNGTLLDEETAIFAAQYGVPILLSLDGLKEVHDRHRRFHDGSPSFDKIMEGMRILRKHQPWVGARVTFTEETVDKLADGIIWLNQNGICQFIIGGATGKTGWTPESMKAMEREWRRIADYYVETRKEGKLPLRIVDFEESAEDTRKKFSNLWGCSAGRTSISVTADGGIYGCSRFATLQDCKGQYKLGSLEEGITRYDYLRDLQDARSLVRNECHKCDYSDACAGTCPAASLELHNNIYCKDPASCALTKTKVKLMEEKPELSNIHKEYPIMHARNKEQGSSAQDTSEHIQPMQ